MFVKWGRKDLISVHCFGVIEIHVELMWNVFDLVLALFTDFLMHLGHS